MLTFSNPRSTAEFDDWPIGGSNRGKCRFTVEAKVKNRMNVFRFTRTTTNKAGAWCKPKVKTYGGPAAIVDGSDGRTYLIQLAGIYDFITVSRSDFFNEPSIGNGGTVYADDPRHAELLALLKETKP